MSKSLHELFLEKKFFADSVEETKKITDEIILDILSDKLKLDGGARIKKLSYIDVKIYLKAFNNATDEPVKAVGSFDYTSSKTKKILNVPIIEIFFFELFNQLRDYRDYPKEKLDIVMKNLLQKNTKSFKMVLAHELHHAIEYSMKRYNQTSRFKDTKSVEDENRTNYLKYLNTQSETTARIVEFITPLNEKWAKQLRQGTWLTNNLKGIADDKIINNISVNIIKDSELIDDFIPKFKRKFAKGIISTVGYLWKKYKKAAQEREKGDSVKLNELMKFVKTI